MPLDESTNHLDFETVEAMAEALRAYHDTLFVVSHDRTFISRIATHVIEIKDSRAIPVPDSYEAYGYKLEQEARTELGVKTDPAGKKVETTTIKKPAARDHKDAQRRLKAVEWDLKNADMKKKALEAELTTGYDSAKDIELTEVTAQIATMKEE